MNGKTRSKANPVRAVIAAACSLLCYGMGHAVSRSFQRWEAMAFMYPVYNRLMRWSYNSEQWAGIDFMWRAPDEK